MTSSVDRNIQIPVQTEVYIRNKMATCFVYAQITSPKGVEKSWFGSKIQADMSLHDFYQQFASGEVDSGE